MWRALDSISEFENCRFSDETVAKATQSDFGLLVCLHERTTSSDREFVMTFRPSGKTNDR